MYVWKILVFEDTILAQEKASRHSCKPERSMNSRSEYANLIQINFPLTFSTGLGLVRTLSRSLVTATYRKAFTDN